MLESWRVDANLPIAPETAYKAEEMHSPGSGALFEAVKSGFTDGVRLLLHYGAIDYENRALSISISVGYLHTFVRSRTLRCRTIRCRRFGAIFLLLIFFQPL